MSDSLKTKHSRPSIDRAEVRDLLQSLRSKLRAYAAVSGLLLLVCCAVVVFWITTGLDSGWFALQKLELPVGLRAVFLAGMLVGGGWLLVLGILRPLVQQLRDLDLALLLERRFPQFQDRLVTAVESQEAPHLAGPLSESMLQQTVAGAADLASAVEPNEVFDLKPLKRRGWLTGALLFSIIFFAVASPGALARWWDAFVKCEPVYRARTTDLHVSVIAQPGDRRVEFRKLNEDLVYLHPRGNDLELEMVVPEGASPSGEPWVVPDRVRIDVIRADGPPSRTYVSATGDGTFRFILSRLQESVRIELLAGDYRTTTPLRIEAVSPPSIDSISLDCTYPQYTGWNQLRETSLQVQGSEVSLPYGTQFELRAISSKRLLAARIVTDLFEISGDCESCTLTPRDDYAGEIDSSVPLLSPDGYSIAARFVVSQANESTSQSTVEMSESRAEGEAISGGDSEDSIQSALPIPSNVSLRFFLQDDDEIVSMNPESMRIRGIKDEPPVIAANIAGVENAITRRAVIPMIGEIRDDYGLQLVGFEFVVDDETQWRPRPFSEALTAGSTEFTLGDEKTDKTESFDVQPLDLSEGQTLALAVIARDNCEVGGFNVTRGDPILFRIVSNEELLSLLYTREINLRGRFEQVIHELQKVRDDLAFHKEIAVRVEQAAVADVATADRVSLTKCATNSGDGLRRQNNELLSIVEGFEDVIEQLINNAIPPRQLAEKMRQDIVVPLNDVTENLLKDADRAVSEFRVIASDGRPSSDAVTKAERSVTVVIARLEQILENVRDMAEFHEALSDLRAILEEQQRVKDKTQQEKLKGFFDDQ